MPREITWDVDYGLELWLEGYPIVEIARRCLVTRRVVQSYAQYHDWPPRHALLTTGNARYYEKLKRERELIAETGGSPYERAVKRIERLTGVPASTWEHDSQHPYTRRAVEAAQRLAGIDPTRTMIGRAA